VLFGATEKVADLHAGGVFVVDAVAVFPYPKLGYIIIFLLLSDNIYYEL